MNPTKTITICNTAVPLLYCTATETGFEALSGKSINDLDFQSQDDLLKLCLAAIIAAAEREKKDPPVTTDQLLFDATSQEIINLMKTVAEMRVAWYKVPEVVTKEETPTDNETTDEEQPKNA